MVLQDSDQNSLVRVSVDGKSVTTIASGVPGVALAIDAAGNYIVVSESMLSRVTPAGVVTPLAKAPEGSKWASVAVDPSGTILVADRLRPVVWRISPDGKSLREVGLPNADHSNMGAIPGLRRASVLAGRDGDCMLLIEGWDHAIGSVARFYRIGQDGAVAEIPLRGVRTRNPNALVPDGSGNYLFVNEDLGGAPNTMSLMRLTMDGAVTKFTDVPFGGGQVRMTRDSQTGDIIVSQQFPGRLLSVRADGSATETLVGGSRLTYPTALAEAPHN